MQYNLSIVGAAGRMGKKLIAIASENSELKIVAAIENKLHPDLGKDAGSIAGISPLNVPITTDFTAKSDVVIDFSQPAEADRTIEYCLENNAALVMGTTGLSDQQQQKITDAAKHIPLIYGTNMSVAMNVLFDLVAKAAKMLGDDYDIEIIEQHHRFKKDAPSGSALTLAENICNATGKDLAKSLVHGRNGNDALRQKGTIGMHAVRAGDITGVHTVMFAGLGDRLELKHIASSRDAFARGAVLASAWLIGKKPAAYTMANCLGLD
jgi:4-hydroxy-tetrahydrodipicolinate reductase